MQQVIYIDVLLCLNLFINYLVLLISEKFLNLKAKNYRLMLASFFGALCSLLIFFPYIGRILLLLISFCCAVLINLICYGFKSFRFLMKASVCFIFINFSFAGIIFLLCNISKTNNAMVKNGIVYFNISPKLFIFMCIVSYIIIRVVQILNIKFNHSNSTYRTQIYLGNKHCNLISKIDTGNSLIEPFSSLPVIVVNKKSLKQLLPFEEIISPEQASKLKYRMIPFNSVGKSGVLKGFKPDYINIYTGNKIKKKEAYVAICDDDILNDGFDALLNPDLL